VTLLVSELVTNAVRHVGDQDIMLEVDLGPDLIRVEVEDEGTGFTPAPSAPEPGSREGWGLYLVDELADRWGVDPRRDRNRVWFEVDR
jgi:anti-sigma regulatory factor (Ser/Thr protein kinase)